MCNHGYSNFNSNFKHFTSYNEKQHKKWLYTMLDNDIPVITRVGTGKVQRTLTQMRSQTMKDLIGIILL